MEHTLRGKRDTDSYFSLLPRLILSLLFSLILASCDFGADYRQHYQDTLLESRSSTATGTVSPMSDSWVEISLLPDLHRLDQLVAQIDGAKSRVWVEIYSWTEKSTLEAVLRAKSRGIDVRVLLEGNVYGSPEMNRPAFESLSSAGIPVVYADNSRFSFTHAKFWIIDDCYSISTGNWSYTSFKSNRDIIISWHRSDILETLSSIFLHDFAHRFQPPVYPEGFTYSPVSTRVSLESLIQKSSRTLSIYTQSLSDSRLIYLIWDRVKSGVHTTICVADRGEEDTGDELRRSFSWLLWIQLREIQKPYPHLKLLIVDNHLIWIGSANFTSTALDKNREVGLLLSVDEIPPALRQITECPIF